jgi:hypothetical protein
MLVVEALARADASIGWCAANASTNSVLSAYLSGPIIREIWDNGPTVLAGALNSNRATAVVDHLEKRCDLLGFGGLTREGGISGFLPPASAACPDRATPGRPANRSADDPATGQHQGQMD